MSSDREPGSPLPLTHQLRFDAGSSALNLLATRGFRGTPDPVERLTSTARLRDWLAGNALPPVAVGATGLRCAQDVREAGYAVLAAAMDGRVAARGEVRTLATWAARPLPGPVLRVRSGRLDLAGPSPDLDGVLVQLARELAERAAAGVPELRRCGLARCQMIYLDRSRGQRRRWCSMSRCGNLAKAAEHRARAMTRG